jgi:hypothetical protein
MPAIGGGDDFVSIGGPDEGLWLLVVVGDTIVALGMYEIPSWGNSTPPR